MNAIGLAAVASLGVTGVAAAQTTAPFIRQTAYIKASNPQMGAHFGSGGTLLGDSVAISSNGLTLAVGAPDEGSASKGINGNQNDTSMSGAGAVYVFTRPNANGAWTQQAYVKASNPGMGDAFGHIVALSADGNTMAVSAYYEASNAKGIGGNQEDDSIPQAGAVYIFVRQAGKWTQQAYIKASNTGEAGTADTFGDGDQFGFALAISGDGSTVAVGANAEDSNATTINGNQNDNSAQSAGAVYIFTRAGAAWTQQAYVKPPNTFQNTQFGYSVSLSFDGNTLAASTYDEGGSSRTINGPYDRMRNGSGAVFIFTRAAGTWSQQAYLKAANAEAGDSLGVIVSLSDDGNTLAAGILDEDCKARGVNPADKCDNDQKDDLSTGAAVVYVRTGTQWSQQAFFKASNTGQDDWFGSRLRLSGDGNTLAISAQLEDSDAKGLNGDQENDRAQEAGSVFVYTRTGSTWTQRVYLKAANNEAFDEFGSSMALSRDGRTLVVGARGEDSGAKGINGNQNDNSVKEAGAVEVFAINPAGK
jgi:hypothetical protein